MSYKDIDFMEPIPEMVDRLVREHRELSPKLDEIEKMGSKNPSEALRLLGELKTTILRHAIQEEARIMRVIMKDVKSESAESVRIMQEHRWVSEFLERRMGELASVPKPQAQRETEKFLIDLRQHFKEEEEVVFPLALKASSMEHP